MQTATEVTNTIKVLTVEELAQTIMTECKKASRTAVMKYGKTNIDATELEGFLITELWGEFDRIDSALRNIKMIRRLINLRTIDYIRGESRFDNQTTFSMMDDSDREDAEESYESTLLSNDDIEKTITMKDMLSNFRTMLSDKQNQILDLVNAGYGNNEICEMIGCSINTPKNTMKKIREIAVQNGLNL